MKYFLAALFLLPHQFSFSQTLTYEIILYGKVIGTTTVQKITEKNGDVHYLLQSSSVAKVLFITRRTSQNYFVTYRNRILTEVEATNNMDGEITNIKITREGNRYNMLRNGKLTYLHETISASTLTLYFAEPVHLRKVFSERIGELYTVNKTAEGTYEYTPSDNVHTTLRYTNGRLTGMEMRKSFITVYLRFIREE